VADEIGGIDELQAHGFPRIVAMSGIAA
jgi:hypothetical protein